jgi:hypothetical protein
MQKMFKILKSSNIKIVKVGNCSNKKCSNQKIVQTWKCSKFKKFSSFEKMFKQKMFKYEKHSDFNNVQIRKILKSENCSN